MNGVTNTHAHTCIVLLKLTTFAKVYRNLVSAKSKENENKE